MNFCKFIKNLFKKQKSMSKKIKKYRVKADESLCLAVSVVNHPAVESEFVFLSEQRPEQFVAVDKKERRMIYGCALRADFPIYRNNGKEEYYIEFDSESIDKISKDFLKNGFQKNWTEGHKDEVENLSVCESWIKESPNLDKSIALGLDADIPVGSWFIGCYCENDDIWEKVKSGAYHGFSCEALVGLEELESQMPKEEEADELKDEEVELEEQAPTVEPTAEPTVEPQEAPKEQEPTETKVEEKEAVVEPQNEPNEEPKVEEPNPLEDVIKNLQDELKALKDANSELQNKVKELGKKPSAKPLNTNAKPSAADTYSQWRSQMGKYLNGGY